MPRADPSRRDHGSVLHRRGQQVSGLLRNGEGQAEAVGKVGRVGGGNAGTPVFSRLRTRSGKLLGGSQVRRMDSKLLGPSPRSAGSEGISVVGAENVSGPSSMGSCSRSDGCGDGAERQGVCSDACCPIHSSSAVVRREQLGAPLGSSGRGAGLENGRVRRKVFCEAVILPRQSLGEMHSKQNVSGADLKQDMPRISPSVNVITIHPYSIRHKGASSDALWRTRSLLKIQLVTSRMTRMLSGAQPPCPPVLTSLVRSRA